MANTCMHGSDMSSHRVAHFSALLCLSVKQCTVGTPDKYIGSASITLGSLLNQCANYEGEDTIL